MNAAQSADERALAEKCRHIGTRLVGGGPSLDPLKERARILNAEHLAEQIRRLESSVESDPSLAIGTAKELIETCCKTILEERGKPIAGTADISTLTKATLRELKLIPEGIPDAARGANVIKRLLSNLGTIGNGLAELRGLYGTSTASTGGRSVWAPAMRGWPSAPQPRWSSSCSTRTGRSSRDAVQHTSGPGRRAIAQGYLS